ncbi:MAG: methyltransferase domain-containing protein [Candidatus Dadabacteria bacterium]|nr:MAG: methyltransferase domain-containing protein [Candidatus Dadabacteria bacterium]
MSQPDRSIESLNHNQAVLERYAAGAQAVEAALCCAVEDYDARYLEIIPQEIIDKDYGCGDPSKHVGPGEVVLDLGSGAGKVCYILAQKVGPEGRVIGVDFNDAMLDLAEGHKPAIVSAMGYDNVSFVKGRIQDLALDLRRVEQYLEEHPVSDTESLLAFESFCDRQRAEAPMIADDSIDVIVSNCVLNLVRPAEKKQLFREMFRVLRRGGRVVISDIVCDEPPTQRIIEDPDLWSGCISGAFVEDEFLQMFADAGFYGIEILSRQEEPWQTVDGIEFRSMTVRAYKGKEGPCLERNQAVVYRGPFKQVHDDDGHVYYRGQRMAVCDKTFRILTDPAGPYADQFVGIEPRNDIPVEDARPFDCRHAAIRDPRDTKGADYHADVAAAGPVCGPEGCC